MVGAGAGLSLFSKKQLSELTAEAEGGMLRRSLGP
jgi:hypothetical protein